MDEMSKKIRLLVEKMDEMSKIIRLLVENSKIESLRILAEQAKYYGELAKQMQIDDEDALDYRNYRELVEKYGHIRAEVIEMRSLIDILTDAVNRYID